MCLVCGFFLVSFGLARLNRVFTSQKTKRKENGRPFRRPQNSKTTTTFQERRGVKVKSKPKNFGTQAERLLILWKNGMLRLGFYRFPLLLFWVLALLLSLTLVLVLAPCAYPNDSIVTRQQRRGTVEVVCCVDQTKD